MCIVYTSANEVSSVGFNANLMLSVAVKEFKR